MSRYYQPTPLEVINELRNQIFTENISALAVGAMLFNQEGVIVTDDVEDEYIPEGSEPMIVESEYAQEISWLFAKLRSGLDDVKTYYHKNEFTQFLAEAANMAIMRRTDRTGILLAILQEATFLTAQTMQMKTEALRDEVMACVGSLNDIIDRV